MRNQNRLSRSRPKRFIRRTICIVVEGEKTEKEYFDDLVKERNRVAEERITVIAAGGGSVAQILSKAIEQLGLGHDQVWCVLDADLFGKNKLDKSRLELALRSDVKVVFSNPCFEVWYRLHFSDSHGELANGNAAKAEANRLMKKLTQKHGSAWHGLKALLDSGAPFRNAELVRKRHNIEPGESRHANASSCVDQILIELGYWSRDSSGRPKPY